MKRAYVDTSVLIAIHFREPGHAAIARSLGRQEQLLSTTLVVAEIYATFQREARLLAEARPLLARLSLFSPDGPMVEECEEALAAGQLRGADLWHVASALAIAGRRGRKALTFATLDQPQRDVARVLGFPTLP